MSVSEILSQKGRDVFTTGENTNLRDTARMLAEKKVGAAVILDSSDKVCGIVSERDLVRVIADQGAAALKSPVNVCMTRKVISCTSDETINSVMEKMTHGRFRHLPVIDNGKLAGIISIGDVVKQKIEQAERDAEDLKRYIAG